MVVEAAVLEESPELHLAHQVRVVLAVLVAKATVEEVDPVEATHLTQDGAHHLTNTHTAQHSSSIL